MPANNKYNAPGFRTRRRRKRNQEAVTTSINSNSRLSTLSSRPRHPIEMTIPKMLRQQNPSTIKSGALDNDAFDFCDATASKSPSSAASLSPRTKVLAERAIRTNVSRTEHQIQSAGYGTSLASLSSSSGHRSSSCIPSFHNAIALDTRFVDTIEGREEHERFHLGVVHFLNSTRSCGLAPTLISWTEPRDGPLLSASSPSPSVESLSSMSKSIGINVCSQKLLSFQEDLQHAMRRFSHGTPTRLSNNDVYSNHSSVMDQIPKEHVADTTWALFGDLGKTWKKFRYHSVHPFPSF